MKLALLQVENAYDGRFRITNLAWNSILSDKNSQEAKDLKNKVEEELMKVYPGAKVKVTGFEQGSVIVKFK